MVPQKVGIGSFRGNLGKSRFVKHWNLPSVFQGRIYGILVVPQNTDNGRRKNLGYTW